MSKNYLNILLVPIFQHLSCHCCLFGRLFFLETKRVTISIISKINNNNSIICNWFISIRTKFQMVLNNYLYILLNYTSALLHQCLEYYLFVYCLCCLCNQQIDCLTNYVLRHKFDSVIIFLYLYINLSLSIIRFLFHGDIYFSFCVFH